MLKFLIFLIPFYLGAINIGEIPPVVMLHDHLGGKIDSTPFSTAELKGKVFYVTYVDPDVSDLNEDLGIAIRAKKFDLAKYGAYAIINMGATWIPNALISSKLKSKQEEFPRVVFVKDTQKSLVKKWNIKDDDAVVMVFGKSGELLYYKSGAHSQADIKKVIAVIENNL